MVGLPREDGPDEGWDVGGIVGTVGIDEDGDLPFEVGDDRADRLALPLPVVEDDAGAQAAGDVRGPVGEWPSTTRMSSVKGRTFSMMSPTVCASLSVGMTTVRLLPRSSGACRFSGPMLSPPSVSQNSRTTTIRCPIAGLSIVCL